MSERNAPLHTLGMVHLRRVPDALLPNPHCSIPTTANELHAGRRPVACDNRPDVRFVNLRRRLQLTQVKCIQIVVFRRQEDGSGKRRRPCEAI